MDAVVMDDAKAIREMSKASAEPAPAFPLHAPVKPEIPPDAANAPGSVEAANPPLNPSVTAGGALGDTRGLPAHPKDAKGDARDPWGDTWWPKERRERLMAACSRRKTRFYKEFP